MAYVYAIIVAGTLRYIGKGRKGRTLMHMHLARAVLRRRQRGEVFHTQRIYSELATAIAAAQAIEFITLADGLTDRQAYAAEVEAMNAVPRSQLWNMIGGGGGRGARKRPRKKGLQGTALREKCAEGGRISQPHATEGAKRMWADPERKAAWIAKRKAVCADPAVKAKMSAGQRRRQARERANGKADLST